MANDRQKLKEKFNELYPNCELYRIVLNGFSHTVIYKDSNSRRHIDGFSSCCPEQHSENYVDEGGNIEAFNDDRAKALFSDFPHYKYQGAPKYFCYCRRKWC